MLRYITGRLLSPQFQVRMNHDMRADMLRNTRIERPFVMTSGNIRELLYFCNQKSFGNGIFVVKEGTDKLVIGADAFADGKKQEHLDLAKAIFGSVAADSKEGISGGSLKIRKRYYEDIEIEISGFSAHFGHSKSTLDTAMKMIEGILRDADINFTITGKTNKGIRIFKMLIPSDWR